MGQKDLATAPGAFEQPFAGEFDLAAAVGAGFAIGHCLAFDAVEETFVPVDGTAEEALADQIANHLFDIFARLL